MRQKIIAANWKMNKTIAESISFINELSTLIKETEHEIVICPPFTALGSLPESRFSLGAQNMHFEDSGAFTGEISALMLKELGCKYVLLGHSERRHIFNESDSLISKKLKKALEHSLIPILCIGETLEQREAGKTKEVISHQLKSSLADAEVNSSSIVIAYEPVWAIGTGKTATPQQAQEVHSFIRSLLKDKDIKILYGGSVKPANSKELLSQEDIDGVLVGGASLDAGSFSEIAN